jgi:hypothetical protein
LLTGRIARLEATSLPPRLREIATAVALEQGLDPDAVIQQAQVILRQIQEAGIPLTARAITAFLASAGPG